ncbi:class I SAM-dependent methyltransferase [Archaeoglobus veneficus]|uniref:Methyltransferase type 12 n=1 Tax=Archaeoglobus veneficus (strain DSM 11195 / SNP6) TaxID=693661 RepID=F2KNZ4_ARCVS|nr:class I SAM-dependent methyltransferase [Archaeoglobus veneficus]AEA46302.1 Methyltransferase type 12 [Archaeoglobus veneficus SNP6]
MPFDPAKKHLLESEEYRKILPVEPFIEVISGIEIRRDVAVDVGAGTGHFTIPLAGIFRKVYAIEISMEMAEYLHKKAHDMGVTNIGVIVTERPPELKADFVLFANVLHEMEKIEEYLEWASKISSVVAVIDWKEDAPFGPPVSERINEEKMVEMLGKWFDVERKDVYRYHYFLLGRRAEK